MKTNELSVRTEKDLRGLFYALRAKNPHWAHTNQLRSSDPDSGSIVSIHWALRMSIPHSRDDYDGDSN